MQKKAGFDGDQEQKSVLGDVVQKASEQEQNQEEEMERLTLRYQSMSFCGCGGSTSDYEEITVEVPKSMGHSDGDVVDLDEVIDYEV